MKHFMDENFLLTTETARTLYHNYASRLPIIDYHCHIDPKEIAENRRFENITQIWLGGDHYKWRLMRSSGIEEEYITGNAPDKDKFLKWAQVLGKAIGNPLYHWSHMELKTYFGYDGVLNQKTAEDVWATCNKKLKEDSLSAKGLIQSSNVRLLCTTDDPADTLEWHKAIAADTSFQVKVLPAFRPDRAMNLENPGYADYLQSLSSAASLRIHTFADLKEALRLRMDDFSAAGCSISDHGLDYAMYSPASAQQIEDIFQKRLAGIIPSAEEIRQFKTAFLLFAASEYHTRNWVMQLHYGCKRNNNTSMFQQTGPDTGFDCINNFTPVSQLSELLNAILLQGGMPKTIVYSLNPNDNQAIDSCIGCFQDSSHISKLQHGSAWWFNDHKNGIREQMLSLASIGNLSGFIGMLTDSRSFLSYTRHEYFRRILCELVGELVEGGEFPGDMDILSEIVSDISYYNAIRYFGFPL